MSKEKVTEVRYYINEKKIDFENLTLKQNISESYQILNLSSLDLKGFVRKSDIFIR